jgi:hypothetical protein
MASSPTVLAGQDLTALLLGVPAWTGMSLLNGWTNTGGGQPTAQYRLWPLINEVEIIGNISAGTLTNNTTIATLPNTPGSLQKVCVMMVDAAVTLAAGVPLLYVDTGGNLKIFGMPGATTDAGFHGWYSLDA